MWLATHIALSSLAVLSFSKLGMWRIHLCSMVLSVILLGVGFAVYRNLLRYRAVSDRETAPAGTQSQVSNQAIKRKVNRFASNF